MNDHINNVRGIMEQEVCRDGSIPFARFMELALYCPNFGYYEREDASPGRAGDFYTSVSVGKVFGELLAFQFTRWFDQMPGGGRRQVVEGGAHDGRLAGDILNWIMRHRPDLWPELEYWILEPSAVARRRQEKNLGDYLSKVRWFDSWDAVPQSGVQGVIFANELFDAMPVHRLGWDAVQQRWFEWGVGLDKGKFVWVSRPLEEASALLNSLAEIPQNLLAILPDGFTTEICPVAGKWWAAAAGNLRQGELMAIDYGLSAEEFFEPKRRNGTLRAYYRHTAGTDLLARPGDQDLTAHVNLTALENAGLNADLATINLQSQAKFLTSILSQIEANPKLFGEWSPRHSRQFQTLVHPEHLGSVFQVLVQSRPNGRFTRTAAGASKP